MPSAWSWTSCAFTWATRIVVGFDAEVLHRQLGFAELLLTGSADALLPLLAEAGAHRWQGPSGRNHQIHSSTVTAAVFAVTEPAAFVLDDRDIDVWTTKASGAGGQHRNKTESAVHMRHRPSGIEVRMSDERSQHRNRAIARGVLEHRVRDRQAQKLVALQAEARREMIGGRQEPRRVRTYRLQDQIAVDHVSGRKFSLARVLAGELPR